MYYVIYYVIYHLAEQSSGNHDVSITLSSVSKMVSLALITVGSQNSLILGVDNTRCKLVAVVLLILII